MTQLKVKGPGRIWKKTYKKTDGSIAEYATWTVRFKKRDYTSGTADERTARRFLAELIRKQGRNDTPKPEVKPEPAEPAVQVFLMDDVFDRLEGDARRRGNVTAFEKAGRVDLHLRPVFGKIPAADLTTDHIENFVDARLEAGAQPATVNNDLRSLKRGLNLAMKRTPRWIQSFPYIELLEENNARQGFLNHVDYLRMKEILPDYLLAPFVVAYHCGSRRGELMQVELRDIDINAKPLPQIRLYGDATKNGEGRIVPIFGEMEGVLREQVRMTKRDYPDCPWLFHKDGEQLLTFYKAWKTAIDAAGLPKLLFHDLRRAAAMNLTRAGVPRTVAMKITGHKTESMFVRYAIVDETDLHDAASKMFQYINRLAAVAEDITSMAS